MYMNTPRGISRVWKVIPKESAVKSTDYMDSDMDYAAPALCTPRWDADLRDPSIFHHFFVYVPFRHE